MATIQDKISGLYAAFFNRTPDLSGFNWWLEQINSGSNSLEDIAVGFANHPVFTSTYGNMSNEEFVNAIYQNMLGSSADLGGLAYYAGKLNNSSLDYSRSDMVAEFIGGVLDADLTNPAFDSLTQEERTAAEQRQHLMQNKVQVAQNFLTQFAEHTNIIDYDNLSSDPAYIASQKILVNVTDESSTVNDAISAITLLSTRDDAISAINSIDSFNLQNANTYVNEHKIDNIVFTGDENSKIELSISQTLASTSQSSQVVDLTDFRTNTAFADNDGSGYSVVILDTGIDLNHPFFGADANNDGISDRIVYTHDFTNDGDGTVDDVNGHGTNVASIAASSSSVYTGMASGANIIALQVLNNYGSGNFSWLEQALQWVVNNASAYNIAAINMSLGDGANSNTIASAYGLGDELAALNRLGVINVAAAGNSYYTYQTEGASNPAVDPNIIAVGATFDANVGSMRWFDGTMAYSTATDVITPFSQRSDTVVDIFAPGATITGAAPGGGVASMTGTSQAAPHIAGIAVLAQDLAQEHLGRRLSNAEFDSLLQSSGVAIVDGDDENDNVANTYDTYYRVDVDALANAIVAMADGTTPITPTPSTDIENNTSTKGILTVGSSVSSTVDLSGDQDWFKIALVSGVQYRFDLVGDSSSNNSLADTYLSFRDSSGNLLASDDDGGIGTNSSLTYTISTSGDYYLSASGYGSYTGDYTLSATQIGVITDDYSDTIATIGIVDSSSSETGAIEISGDKDWFLVNLTAGNRYTIDLKGASSSSGTLSNPYIYGLYNSSGTLISGTSNDNGGSGYDAQLIYDCQTTGTYYISAGGNSASTGTYTISLSSQVLVTDDYTSDIQTTGILTSSTSVTGSIERSYDIDWYAVSLSRGYTYTFNLEGSPTNQGTLSDTYIRGIYDSLGTLLSATSDDDSGTGTNAQVIFTPLTDGTYYISAGAFSSHTGTYTISMSSQVADDYPDNIYTSGVLSTSQAQNANINSASDTDWFQASLARGYIYTFTMTGDTLSDAEICGLYNSNGYYVSNTYNNGGSQSSSVSVTYAPTTSGTYYIAASGYGSSTGTYAISMTSAIADDYTSNIYTAGNISVDSSANGNIETISDTDWFSVYLYTGYAYQFDSSMNISGLYNSSGIIINGTNVNDDTLSYTPTTSGRYYVSIASNGSTGLYTLDLSRISVSDDHGSTVSSYGTVTVGGSVAGSIETSYDTDWYAISLSANTRYTVDLKGSATSNGTLSDTYLRGIYDSSGTLISGTSDDDSGYGLNSQVLFTPDTTATYYISAGAYGSGSGTYTLSIDNGTAVVPDVGNTTSSHGTITVGNSISDGLINSYYDHDWYAVDLSSGYSYTINADSSSSIYTYIRDAQGNYLYPYNGVEYNYSSTIDDSKIFRPQSSGIYYIDVYGYSSNSTYTLSVSNGTSTGDDHGSTVQTAGTVTVGGSVAGSIETSYDTDWYAISLSANTRYTVDLKGSATSNGTLSDTYLRGIYNSSGTLISGTSDDDSGYGLNSQVLFTPDTTATYYISAGAYGSGSGTYTLSIDNGTAVVPDVGNTTSSHGSITVGNSISDGLINSYYDHDWYAVDLSVGYKYDIIANSTNSSVYMYIMDSNGNYLYSNNGVETNYDYSVDSSKTFTPQNSGTYYINVYGYTADSTYTLSVSNGAAVVPDVGNTTSSHGTVTVDGSVTGSIETSYDTDWYAISLSANTRYTVDLKGSATSNGTLSDTYLRGIYNSSGTLISGTSDDDSGYGSNSQVSFIPDTTATYYISAGAYGSNIGTYTLMVEIA